MTEILTAGGVFKVGYYYYNYSSLDEPNEDFVGKFTGIEDGMLVFENSKGEKRDALHGHFFDEATPDQITDFY